MFCAGNGRKGDGGNCGAGCKAFQKGENTENK